MNGIESAGRPAKRTRRGAALFGLAAAAGIAALSLHNAEAQAPPVPGTASPHRIVIMYRCDPADRPAALAAMRSREAAQFENWKKEGAIGDYLLLFNSFCDENTWDMMAVLMFDSYVQTDKWRDVEERFPGGLSKEVLAIMKPTQTYLAEARWSFGKALDKKRGLYMVIPYEHPDRGVYADFVNSVLVPQFEGWMREGALNNWTIMLTNHYPGKPWDVLLLLEYDGPDGLSRRETARQATADRLEQDPGWRLLREISLQFRSEYEVVTARAVEPE